MHTDDASGKYRHSRNAPKRWIRKFISCLKCSVLLTKRTFRLSFVVGCFLLLLLISVAHDFRHWIALPLSHLRNSLLDTRITCGTRKMPRLHRVGDAMNHSAQYILIWERNCPFELNHGQEMIQISYQINDMLQWNEKATWQTCPPGSIIRTELDNSHIVYRVVGCIRVPLYLVKSTLEIALISRPKGAPRSLIEKSTKWHLLGTWPMSYTNFQEIETNIIWIADNQYKVVPFRKLLAQIMAASRNGAKVDLVIHGGDMVQEPHELQMWQTDFYDALDDHMPNTPIVMLRGNHDSVGSEPAPYATNIGWYSFVHARILFIILDGNRAEDSEQIQWLNGTLHQAKMLMFDTDDHSQKLSSSPYDWIIVCIHIPPFVEFWDPEAWNDRGEKDWNEPIQRIYVPLFVRNKVSVVISGHQHNYQRGQKDSVHYVISGGGGGELDWDRVETFEGLYKTTKIQHHYLSIRIVHLQKSVRCLEIEALDSNGATIDSFHLS